MGRFKDFKTVKNCSITELREQFQTMCTVGAQTDFDLNCAKRFGTRIEEKQREEMEQKLRLLAPHMTRIEKELAKRAGIENPTFEQRFVLRNFRTIDNAMARQIGVTNSDFRINEPRDITR